MTAPDWLTIRDCALASGLNDRTVVVTQGGRPAWQLDAVPAKGTFTCAVIQTTNGRRLDEGMEYPTREQALAGGLEELRANLGW